MPSAVVMSSSHSQPIFCSMSQKLLSWLKSTGMLWPST